MTAGMCMCEFADCEQSADRESHGFWLCDQHANEHNEMCAAQDAADREIASEIEEDRRVEAALDRWRGA